MGKINDRDTLLSVLATHSDQLRSYGVKALGLFGSFVRNKKIHAKSDIDFVVDFYYNQNTFRHLMDLGFFLEDITGRKVELITRDGLSKHIGPYILQELTNVPLKRRSLSKAHKRLH